MAKISIIIPVYNVKEYIGACIESVLAQTLTDIEIICVDDGSNDGSELILDDFAKRDLRVKVIHKENAGYGAAMNTGVRAATGQYIGIVESDDIIAPSMYEELYNNAKSDDLDLVKSDAYYWLESYDFKQRIHVKKLEDYYDKVLTEENRDIFYEFYMNTWTGIYKREFLLNNDIWHSETPGASYQDNGFWIQTMSLCKKAKWLNKSFYYYRQDNPMASVKSKSKVYAMKNEYELTEQRLMEKASEEIVNICRYYRAFRNKGTFMRIADELKEEFSDTIVADYKAYQSLINRNTSLHQWYQEITNNPSQYCKDFVDAKKKIETQLEVANQIVIYGAGAYGKKVFRNLVNLGFAKKISYFTVTKCEKNEKVGTFEVRNFAEVEDDLKDKLVIVATAPNSVAYCEMKQKLRLSGVNKILDAADMNEYFYLV